MINMKRLWKKIIAILLGITVNPLPHSLLACTACYGAADAPAQQAMNMAIFCLLGFVGGVLAGIVAFIFYLKKKGATAVRMNSMAHSPKKDPLLDLPENIPYSGHGRLSTPSHQPVARPPTFNRWRKRFRSRN